MKKLLVLICLALPFTAIGQNYRKVFFAIDLGMPMAKQNLLGSFTLEPNFRINDKMSVGLRLEQRLFLSASLGGKTDTSTGSIGLSYQYYLPVPKRIFVGGGMAVFNPTNNFLMSNSDTQNERNRWGFFPRIGIDLGHFRLVAEYNFVGNMTEYFSTFGNNGIPGGFYESVNKSYFSLKLGFFIGGGRKK